ncbi:hypothetical protein GCM10027299_58590 [Larkinella ripae]
MTHQKTITLPHNLDLGHLLETQPPHHPLAIDKLQYILGLIYELPAYDHRFLPGMEDDVLYVPLNSQLLKRRIRDYQHYLRYLVTVGVLECDNIYIKGIKSRGYQFTETYRVKTSVVTITDPKLVQPDGLQQEKRTRAREQYPYLIHHFAGLQIDVDRAQAYIDGLYEEQRQSADGKVRRSAASRHGSYQTMIHRLVGKTEMFSVDTSGHRFHSPLTNLKSELRQFLSFNGQPLVAIDLSCSQPYLAMVLFHKDFYQPTQTTQTLTLADLPELTQKLLSPALIDRIITHIDQINSSQASFNGRGSVSYASEEKNNGTHHEINSRGSESDGTSSVNLVDSNENNISASENKGSALVSTFRYTTSYTTGSIEAASPSLSPRVPIMCATRKKLFSQFKNAKQVQEQRLDIAAEISECTARVSQGNLYEYLGEKLQKVTGKRIKSRKALKAMISTALFSENDEYRVFFVARKEAFQSVFPWVLGLLELLKQDNHTRLAHILQTIESHIFLNRIAGRISQESPEVPLFTIHDCLATTYEFEGYVEQVIREELESAIGIVPHLKREEWSSDDKEIVS